jgi:hypothetical protein
VRGSSDDDVGDDRRASNHAAGGGRRRLRQDAQSTVSAFNADTSQLLWRVTPARQGARPDEFGGGRRCGGRLFVTTGFWSSRSMPTTARSLDLTVSAPVRGAPSGVLDRVPSSASTTSQSLAAVVGRTSGVFEGQSRRAMSAATPHGSADLIVAPFSSGGRPASNGRPVGSMVAATRRRAGVQLTGIRGAPIDRGVVLAMARRAVARR